MVGVQTKFNYAWVRSSPTHGMATSCHADMQRLTSTASKGSRKIKFQKQPTDGSTPSIRDISSRAGAPPRVSVLPCSRKLQAGQLWRGEALQRFASRKGAGEPASL